MEPRAIKKIRGFTLLEVLLAVAIFAIVGVMASLALHQMIGIHQRLKDDDSVWQEMMMTHRLLQRDFSQLSRVRTTDERGNVFPLLRVSKQEVVFNTMSVSTNNVLPTNYQPLQVNYRVQHGGLMRTVRPIGDDDSTNTPQHLLTGIQAMQWFFLYQGNWFPYWTVLDTVPQAVKVDIQLKNKGHIEWVMLIGGGQDATT